MIKQLLIQYLPDTDRDFPIPEYQTAGSSGIDLRAYLPPAERRDGVTLIPGQRLLVSSGFIFEIPDRHEGQIRARSGLALKYGIALANGIGTIDSDFRGPLGIILINLGSLSFTVKHGQRIAQLIIAPYSRVKVQIMKNGSKTSRGDSGYGSTGNF